MSAWSDYRPIGQLIMATSNAGWKTNPNGWFLDSTIDTTTPAGVKAFQARALAWADGAVQVLTGMNSQGMVLWDGEGEKGPQPAWTYVGDPTQIATLAPEFDPIADQFYKKFTDAGLFVGCCLRPQAFNPATGQHTFLPNEQIATALTTKAKYARNRWGCRLFYVDSTVDITGQSLPASIMQQFAANMAGCLVMPENETDDYYAFSWPYGELANGDIGAPARVIAKDPAAVLVNCLRDADLTANHDALVAAVKAKNAVLMFRGWFPDPQNAKVAQIYKDAAAAPVGNPPDPIPTPTPTPIPTPGGTPTMTFTMNDNEHVAVSVAPVDAAGNPSKAALSKTAFTSSDESVLTVGVDPANANGALLIAVKAGTVDVTATASAANPDGTQAQSVTGKATVTLTHSPAAGLVFSFGTPTP